MANPRQRRKTRSGNHKPVQHSQRAKKLLKKQPPIRGPKVLQEAWDPRKTVRQNYETLGLVATLNPTASGGTERVEVKHADRKEASAEREASATVSRQGGRTNGVPKGYGKIIRDGEGNIVEVQLGEEGEGEEPVTQEQGVEEEIQDPRGDKVLAGWVGLGSDPAKGDAGGKNTRVVHALERLSEAGAGAVPRFTSKGEHATLELLVRKHGDDLEAMARDRKVNVDQRTAGELRRAIRKAGGIGALGVGAG
ncbi:ribosome biogenesis protein Nop16 [Ganoderma leucocontextum]|nr:ribosome biogenesis protein Nop16 [Ganoderma leucocontextum]